jgi:hypothetical protein
MNTARTVCLGLACVATIACSSVAPVKIAAGDQCFRCRRTITNDRIAAETIDGNYFVSKFRGPACMAKYLAAHPGEHASIFVTDFPSGKMLPPQQAFFVRTIVDQNTFETEYRAYGTRRAADEFASSVMSPVVTWGEVLGEAH